jgi:hypothetical protein
MKPDGTVSPVSYSINVTRLARSGLPVWLEADAEQRAALARAHGLLEVESFRLDLMLTPWKGDAVKVTGKVVAAITQACVVTLEPVSARIDAPVETIFVPEGSKMAIPGWIERGEMVLDAEGPDAPEIFSGDSVDVGALAEEFFALAIEPYPRKTGVSVNMAAGAQGAAGEESHGPLYEKLRDLADKS